MGGFSKWKKLEEAHGRDTAYYANDTRSQEEIMGYSLADRDYYEENERQRREIIERLNNRERYTSNPIGNTAANTAADTAEATGGTTLDRVRNWFSAAKQAGGEKPVIEPNAYGNNMTGKVNDWLAKRDKRIVDEEQRSADWFAEREAKYGDITSRPDFFQNIDGWETQMNYARQITENTPEAEAYRNYMLYTPENMRDPEMERRLRENYEQASRAHVDESIPMERSERQVYQYLLNTQGEDAAKDYYDYISYAVNARQMDDLRLQAEENTSTGIGKVLASAASVPANLIGGFGILDIAKQNIRNQFGEYRPVDYNSAGQQLGNYAQAVRESASEDMGGVGRFLYGTGMSIADSAVSTTLFGRAGSLFLGMTAAQNAVQDAHERGASDSQALASGLFAGAAEVVMEYIGIDHLFDLIDSGMTDSVKNIILGVLSQAGSEALEEGGTTLANTIADGFIMGDKSQLRQDIELYETEYGFSHEDATRLALINWAAQIGLDMLGGGISGVAMGGVGQAIGTFDYGRYLKDSKQAQNVVDYAAQFGSDAAKNLAQRVGTGDDASAMQIGRMASVIDPLAIDADGNINMDTAIAHRIEQLEQEIAQRETSAARRKAQASTAYETAQEKPTQSVKQAANTAKETSAANAQAAVTGDTTAANTQNADTNTANADTATAVTNTKKTRAMTVQDARGNNVELVDVAEGQDDSLTFLTADGRQVSVDRLNFDNAPKAKKIAEYAGRMNEDGARGLVENYAGGDVMPYVRGYNEVYNNARAGMSMTEASENASNLSESAIRAAYIAGQLENMRSSETGEVRGGVVRAYNGTLTKQQEQMINVLDTVFRGINRTVEIVDELDVKDANGNVIRKSGNNAQFDERTNRYIVSLDALDESLVYVAVHETVHDIKKNAQEEYELLRELVFDWLKQSGEDIDALREHQRGMAPGNSDAYYDEEIVANTVPRIFAERETFEQFAESFVKDEGSRSAFMRLVDGVLDFIRKALDKLAGRSEAWAQVRKLSEQHDMIQAVRDQYFAALDTATRQEANGEGETRYSLNEKRNSMKDDLEAENRQLKRDVRTAQTEAAKAQQKAERTEQRLAKAEERADRAKQRYDQRETAITRRKYLDRIDRTANELYQWTAKPTDKKHVPAFMTAKVVNLLRALDYESRPITNKPTAPVHPGENATEAQIRAYNARQKVYERRLEAYNNGMRPAQNNRSLLWAQRMQELSETLLNAEHNPNDETVANFGKSVDPDLAYDIKAFADANSNVPIATMTPTQLRDLSRLLGRVKKNVTEINRMHGVNRGKQTSATVEQSAADFRARRAVAKTPMGKLLSSGLFVRQMSPVNFFKMLGSGATTVFDGLRGGFDSFVVHIDEGINVAQTALKGVDMKRLTDVKKGIDIETADGTIRLTRAQVMSLYCLDKREAGKRHLYGENGGIVSVRDNVHNAHAVTEEQVRTATGKLTEQERKAADALRDFMSTQCTEWGNEATMELYGYEKFGGANYFPIQVTRTSVNESDQRQTGINAQLYAIRNRGFTKSLDRNATNPLVLDDILSVYSKHVTDMAEYNAYLAPLTDAMHWYNWRGSVKDGTSVNLHRELVQAFPDTVNLFGDRKGKTSGNAVEDYFLNFIRELNGGGSRAAETIPMLSNAKSAAVGWNPSVAIQQAASYSKALSMIDRKWLNKGLPTRRNMRLAQRYAPISKWKNWGFFQSATGRNVETLLSGDTSRYSWLKDNQGAAAEFMDRITWARLWGACEAEQRAADPGREAAYYQSEEFYRKVGAKLSGIIDETQVVDSVFHRSPVNNNKAISLMTAFMSETMKTYSMLSEAVYNYRVNKTKENKAHLDRTVRGVVASQLSAAFLQAIVGAWRDKDDEKGDDWAEKALIRVGLVKPTGKYTYAERYMVRTLENMAGNLNPLNLHWVTAMFSETISNALGGWSSTSTLDAKWAESLGSLLKELKKGDEADPKKFLRYSLDFGAYVTGIGVQNFYRDFIETPLRKLEESKTGYVPSMDEVFYFGAEGMEFGDSMAAVLAAETAKEQADHPAYSADKAEREARGNLRSDVTREYKAVYVQAFIDGDKETMQEIRDFMEETGLYVDGSTPSEVCERWVRDGLKTQYLDADSDEERQRLYDVMIDGNVYTRSELSEAIRNWTE